MIEYQAIRKARVYLREIAVGVLEKQKPDLYSFQYDAAYLHSKKPIPIACSFPLRANPFHSSNLHSFFDNLILEGWLLSHAERVFHIDKKNRFALLMAVGRSPIGAVYLHPLDEFGEECLLSDYSGTGGEFPTRLEEIEFLNRSACCPSCLRPSPKGKIYHSACAMALWGTARKLTLELDATQPLETFSKTIYGGSISGAQRKGLFALNVKSGVLHANPLNSQYILKPDGDYPELPANEHLTMAIARELGFNVPAFALIRVPSLGYVYVVRRFDRKISVQGGIFHRMEDMAQIIGTLSDDKYESSNEKVAKAIQLHAFAPRLDFIDFFRRLVFCFLTANGDMHLKNWSLLEKDTLNGELDLSPCYDFLNTRLPIPREQIDIGLSIRGKNRNLQRSYFEKFAIDSLQIDQKYLSKFFLEVEEWMQVILEFASRSYLTEKSRVQYLKIVEERFQILKN